MISVRLAFRRPIFRCLHGPPAQLRHRSKHAKPDIYDQLKAVMRNVQPERPQNVEELVSVHRAEAIRRANAIRKRNWLALGAALSMIAPMLLVKLWDIPEPQHGETRDQNPSRGVVDMILGPPAKTDAPRSIANEWQGKKVVVAAGDKVIAAPATSENPQASDPDAVELVETGTSYVPYFPRTIRLPTNSAGPENIASDAEYQLLGLGIRKVSFLRVQVYVVGLYVKTDDLSKLQNQLIATVNPAASALIPGEKDELRASLLDPQKSIEIWDSILTQEGTSAVDMAFRVVPCRGTDFKHLQDGWMRGIASRTDEVRLRQAELLRQQAAESKTVALPQPVEANEFADESFGLAMKDFKNLFHGKGKAPKGSVIILARDRQGVLRALYQPLIQGEQGNAGTASSTWLGEVRDSRVGRLIWLLYLGGQTVSSEAARRNIIEGCISITERPVGTVEAMVS